MPLPVTANYTYCFLSRIVILRLLEYSNVYLQISDYNDCALSPYPILTIRVYYVTHTTVDTYANDMLLRPRGTALGGGVVSELSNIYRLCMSRQLSQHIAVLAAMASALEVLDILPSGACCWLEKSPCTATHRS